MPIQDLDLDAIQRRNRNALSFATEQVGGSEYAPETVMEHFDQDVPALIAEVGQLHKKHERLLAANLKLVDRLAGLEGIEDERDRALGQLEDARRQMRNSRPRPSGSEG